MSPQQCSAAATRRFCPSGLCRAAPRTDFPSMATGSSPVLRWAAQVRTARSSTSGSSAVRDVVEGGDGGGGEAPQAMAVVGAKGAQLLLGQRLGELGERSHPMVAGELRGRRDGQHGGQRIAPSAPAPELRDRVQDTRTGCPYDSWSAPSARLRFASARHRRGREAARARRAPGGRRESPSVYRGRSTSPASRGCARTPSCAPAPASSPPGSTRR